jgi:hypothetical protein
MFYHLYSLVAYQKLNELLQQIFYPKMADMKKLLGCTLTLSNPEKRRGNIVKLGTMRKFLQLVITAAFMNN